MTEAGEGEDGRMKSAIGIGSLLMDGLGDTIRVSLTEDPEFEIIPCRPAPLLGRLSSCTWAMAVPSCGCRAEMLGTLQSSHCVAQGVC